MMEKSEYSNHFENVGEAEYKSAWESLERGFEKLRTWHDLSLLRRYLRGPRVLDFPIGTARIFPHLIDNFEISGKDISALYVEKAKRDFPAIQSRFNVGSFEEPGEGGPFDSIYSLRVLNNVKNFDLAVENVSALLADDGVWMFNLPPARAKSAETRDALSRHGFSIERAVDYDWLSAFRTMTYPERKLRQLWIAAAAQGLAPYWLHRLLDMIVPRKGLTMIVARKTGIKGR